ncbi:hypothetical protein CGLO_04586 [Colletotrichum gloeosporioides Cg-14]|uniref:Uncharacterized protein n=1 Tax=Colletotrichum gloeosporioides (strain Cg-14) TaxID=1237896 RepID=T0LUP8_COLGC|nr:hypothetical protein CGLO_04586 [Colletotrichum gloeosporioides Cg-14]
MRCDAWDYFVQLQPESGCVVVIFVCWLPLYPQANVHRRTRGPSQKIGKRA